MMDRIPIVEKYRGVGVHDFQDRDRIEDVVKPAIDAIHAMNNAADLYQYACDFRHPPEARLFAAAKVRAIFETRAAAHENRGDIDMDLLACCVSGLDKIDVFGMQADYYFSLGTPTAFAPGVWQTLPRRPEHEKRRFLEARARAEDPRLRRNVALASGDGRA
jgi:hypothetical protein